MHNPTGDPKVALARSILGESRRLHTAGATRRDLLYYVGRLQSAVEYLLEVVDALERPPRVPDTSHTFASSDGETYTCSRCGRVADSDSVWRLSILEACGGERQ